MFTIDQLKELVVYQAMKQMHQEVSSAKQQQVTEQLANQLAQQAVDARGMALAPRPPSVVDADTDGGAPD